MRVPDATGFESVISESWSPLILALPLPELRKVQRDAIGDISLFRDKMTGRHVVLTYDVGGGSTDMSLFIVEIADLSKITVREIATDGDHNGRGSLFPLVSTMLNEHLSTVYKMEQRREVRVDRAFRKPITSLGACFLAEMTLKSVHIRFVSEARPVLGVVGDRDPKTGHPRFLPLVEGYPSPKDGIVAVPRPLPPGTFDRMVELVLAADKSTPITPDHPRMIKVSREVALTPDQAEGAHIWSRRCAITA